MADPALQLWLHSRLETAFSSTDAWVVEGVAAALLCCGDAGEAQTTVDNFLGESAATPALVQELFERRSAAAAPPAVLREQGGRELRAYVKPPRELPPARAAEQPRPSTASSTAAPSAPRGSARKSAAAAAAAECECPAPGSVWRGAVVNCLGCGLVHDCRGDSALRSPALQRFLDTGTCSFCGKPVSVAEPPGCDQAGAVGAAEAALRLVTFDREGAQRNALIDDQCDYVSAEDANPWLSAQEKDALRVAAAAAAAAAEERRKRVSVTIDLVGRRVLTAGDAAEGEHAEGVRLFSCPAPHTPKYVSQQCADDTAPKQKQKQRANA